MERVVGSGVIFVKHTDNLTPISHMLNGANAETLTEWRYCTETSREVLPLA